MSEKLDLICPECQKTNTANLKTELHCKYCREELTDKTYTKEPKKCVPFFTSMVAGTILGGVGIIGGEIYLVKQSPVSEKITQNNAPNRYSINDEYLIVDSCISQDKRPLKHVYLIKKQEICVCALEKSQIAYRADHKKNELEFLNVFEEKANECMNNVTTAAEPAAEASPY